MAPAETWCALNAHSKGRICGGAVGGPQALAVFSWQWRLPFLSLQWHELELGLGICRKQHLSRIWHLALRIPAPLGALWQPGVCRKGKYFPIWSLVNWSLHTPGVSAGAEQHFGLPAADNMAAKWSFSPIPVQLIRGETLQSGRWVQKPVPCRLQRSPGLRPSYAPAHWNGHSELLLEIPSHR